MKDKLGLGLSVMAGILGAAATLLIGHTFERADAKSAASEVRSEREVIIRKSGNDSRTAALEAAVRRLEVSQSHTMDDEGAENEPEGDNSPTPEEARLHVVDTFSQLEKRHEEDPVDLEWAGPAEKHLNEGLQSLSEKMRLSVLNAECKTEMCRAEVEWENYATAKESGLRLAEVIVPGLNCAQSIWLDEPKDPDSRYSAKLYLDCANQRAGLVDGAFE